MICVDASVAAKWILREPNSAKARALYRAAVEAGEQIVAPSFLPVEVTNILRQRTRRGSRPLSRAAAIAHLQRFLAFPITFSTPGSLHELALNLAIGHKLPAAYDAHYVALAQLLACNFWTADQRLFDALKGDLPFVRWIGDYPDGEG